MTQIIPIVDVEWCTYKERNTSCPEEYFSCLFTRLCIPNSAVCDGKYDCEDWTDELDCGKLTSAIL